MNYRITIAFILSLILLGCSSSNNENEQQSEAPDQPAQKQSLPLVDFSGKLDQLATFSRVSGAIQFYYPGDGAAATDWDKFNVLGFYKIAATESDEDFVSTLRELFSEVAPDVAFNDESFTMPTFEDNDVVTSINYNGYMDTYEDTRQTVYSIFREELTYQQAMEFRSANSFSKSYGSLDFKMPLVLKTENGNTIPNGDSFVDSSEWILPTDISNPYACMTITSKVWNGIQHFWPYFDTIDVDWEQELPKLISTCANDSNKEKLDQLSQSLTLLEDNHIGYGLNKYYQIYPYHTIPLGFDWAESKPVVVFKHASAPESIEYGDELVAVDATPIDDLVEQYAPYTLKSTVKRKHRAFAKIFSRPENEVITLDLRDSNGSLYSIDLKTNETIGSVFGPTMDAYTRYNENLTNDLENDILYLNGYMLTPENTPAVIEKAQNANAIVLDLRNYPTTKATWAFLAHLTDNAIHSLPLYTLWTYAPDRTEVNRKHIPQNVSPKLPYIDIPIAVLSSRYSQSLNEHLLGYIQSAGLPIFGEPTSGINGNITELHVFPHDEENAFRLLFTGMEVTQHDGTAHIGVGIEPDIFVERSIESIRNNTDNQLETAVDYLNQQLAEQK